MSQPLIVVAGPTGSGKSELALGLAGALGGEIVNYDSVQIYRGFDIGSAKPSPETRSRVPHHLYDLLAPEEEFNAAEYSRVAGGVIADIEARKRRAIFAGGTYFYLKALLTGLPEMPGRDDVIRERLQAIASRPRGPQHLHRWLLKVDPESGRRIAPGDRHRVERALEVWVASGRPISSWERPTSESADELPSIKIALTIDRERLVKRLDRRTEEVYRRGLVEETRELLRQHPRTARPFGTIGYKEALGVIDGTLTTEAAIVETQRRTRAYSKRQMTWLRSERNVHWVDGGNPEESLAAALRLIEDRV